MALKTSVTFRKMTFDSQLVLRLKTALVGLFQPRVFFCCRFGRIRFSTVFYPITKGIIDLHVAAQSHPRAMIIIIVPSNLISWH